MKLVPALLALVLGLPLLITPISAIWRGKAFGFGRLTERGDEGVERTRILIGGALVVPILVLGLLRLFRVDLSEAAGLVAIIPSYLLLLMIHSALYNGIHWGRGRPFRVQEEPISFWLQIGFFAAVAVAFYAGFVAALLQLAVFQ